MDTDTAIWILGVLCHKILLPFWFLFNYLKMQKLFFTCGLYQSRWQTRSGLWAIACQPPTGTFNAVIDMVGFKSANLIFVFYLSHLFFVLLSLFSSLLLDLLRAFCSALCPLLTCWPYLIILFFSVVALGLQYASLMIIKYFQVILCHFAEGMRPLQQYMFIFPSHPLNYRCHIYYFYSSYESHNTLGSCMCVCFNSKCLLKKYLKWGTCLLYLLIRLPLLVFFIPSCTSKFPSSIFLLPKELFLAFLKCRSVSN